MDESFLNQRLGRINSEKGLSVQRALYDLKGKRNSSSSSTKSLNYFFGERLVTQDQWCSWNDVVKCFESFSDSFLYDYKSTVPNNRHGDYRIGFLGYVWVQLNWGFGILVSFVRSVTHFVNLSDLIGNLLGAGHFYWLTSLSL